MISSRTIPIIAVISTAPLAIAQTTVYVNGSCGDNTWTGLSPVCEAPNGPKRRIQVAINTALAGDEIIVADGIYVGPRNRNLDFRSKAVTLRSENGPENCIIDCLGLGRGFYFHNGETADAVLEGFTIRNGSEINGGGILCQNASPTILNCVLANNEAEEFGGGMAIDNQSNPTVSNCTFSGNNADYGGGMYNDGRSPIVTDCIFNGNSAVSGGGLYNNVSRATVTNCAFIENSALSCGGGMVNVRSNPAVTNCAFTDNVAGALGAGMCNGPRSDPNVTSCAFSGNKSARDGGGMFNGGAVTVTNCAFSRNTAARYGGAMYNSLASLTVTNCTFKGNRGGSSGGGMFNRSSSAAVTNCILWNDSPDEIVDIDGATSVHYSDVQGAWPGQGNIDSDPLFLDPANDDYRLAPGSPCIDAADNTAVPAGILTDLAGGMRFVDDPATPDTGVPGGGGGPAIVDMGAYEFPCDPCDMNCDGTVDASDIEFFIDILFNGATRCNTCTGDTNGDGSINALDIEPFLECLFP